MTDSITTADLTLGAPVSTVDRLGQATAIEQSRAVAEVQAAVYLAKQFPRDEREAQRAMENSCRQPYVAERAFYRLPRAGDVVTGPTIQLAKELARCWGHIHYGPGEMHRTADRSEMLVYAWDVQSGTRAFATFIVPHRRDKTDKKTGAKSTVELVTMQEIYEQNANQAARRLREQIFGVLPSWFTETAQELCRETLRQGNGTPIEERRAACIAGFAELGITERQLQDKLDLTSARWTGHELAQLVVIFRAIKNGEISKDVEFPPDDATITTADIVGATAPATAPAKAAEPKPAPAAEPAPQPAEQNHPTGESVSSSEDTDAGSVQTEPPAKSTVSHLIDEKDLPQFFAETGLKREPDAAGKEMLDQPSAEGEQLPSADGPKARRAQVTALVTLLKDKGAVEHKDHLAVVSTMLDQPIPALVNLSAAEVTYLYNRVDGLTHKDFAGLLERARRIAAGG